MMGIALSHDRRFVSEQTLHVVQIHPDLNVPQCKCVAKIMEMEILIFASGSAAFSPRRILLPPREVPVWLRNTTSVIRERAAYLCLRRSRTSELIGIVRRSPFWNERRSRFVLPHIHSRNDPSVRPSSALVIPASQRTGLQ